MADIKENGKGGYEVTICHQDGPVPTTYVVTLIPDAKKLSFSTGSIRQGHTHVIGDLRLKIDRDARRKLMTHLREALTYKKGRKRICREERLDFAFVLTLADYQKENRHVRVRTGDFKRLWELISKLDHVVKTAIISRKEFGKEEVKADYFQTAKRELLVELDNEYHLAGNNRRDLFSSTLTRYYGYRSGYVNRADYDTAKALLPGFRLLWSSL
jgi:hypothetical protein